MRDAGIEARQREGCPVESPTALCRLCSPEHIAKQTVSTTCAIILVGASLFAHIAFCDPGSLGVGPPLNVQSSPAVGLSDSGIYVI